MLTHQQMFNTVLNNLTKQGVASTVPNEDKEEGPNCVYRGDSDRRCAAGHLILDNHYHENLEGDTVRSIQVRAALIKSGMPDTSEALHLVHEMQQAHDINMPRAGEVRTIQDFHDYMREVADKFDLEFTLEKN
jgi:hypothetical protein